MKCAWREEGRLPARRRGALLTALVLTAASGAALAASPPAAGGAQVPRCPSLTIVTAVSQPQGDYESIKRIQLVDGEGTVVHYSNERWLDDDKTNLQSTKVLHRVRRADELTATNYLIEWVEKLPFEVPETTSLGPSRAVLEALKSTGKAELSIIQDVLPEPSLDRSSIDYIMNGKWTFPLVRDPKPATVEVLVNGVPTKLPAVHATGNLWDEKVEFFFLDDLDNPLALHFRLGIDRFKEVNEVSRANRGENAMPSDDRSTLRVVRLSWDCRLGDGAERAPAGAAVPGSGNGREALAVDALAAGASEALVDSLEQGLDTKGEAVDVYDIFFTFDSALIRTESEPTLAAIAALLTRHADWRLALGGHTDAIAGDAYNLTLSTRRAEAVKAALVARGVNASRLTAQGFGESRPRATNDTLEGRARNRRVELVRQ
jgi:outer membrane protein OmpA-like peptidoglycan-associated protein